MRRIIIALASTISGLVLLFSWPTSLNQPVAENDTSTDTTTDTTASKPDRSSSKPQASSASSAAPAAPAPSPSPAPASTSTTYTGASVSTRYGNVTVQITVTDGALSGVTAVDYPDRNREDQQINSYAIPILDREALAAGSANISLVSGATYTSNGYTQSLQSALDQAGL